MSPSRKNLKLGEILVQDQVITQAQLQEALSEQAQTHHFLGDILVCKEWVTEQQLLRALGDQFDMPYVDLHFSEIDWAVPAQFPAVVSAPEQYCFPFKRDSLTITVAIANPLEMWGVTQVEERARGLTVLPVLASKAAIQLALDEFRRRSLQG